MLFAERLASALRLVCLPPLCAPTSGPRRHGAVGPGVLERRLVDPLMVPARDGPVVMPCDLILLQQALGNQFADKAFHFRCRDVVGRKNLGLQSLRTGGMDACVVAEIP